MGLGTSVDSLRSRSPIMPPWSADLFPAASSAPLCGWTDSLLGESSSGFSGLVTPKWCGLDALPHGSRPGFLRDFAGGMNTEAQSGIDGWYTLYVSNWGN